MALKKAIKGIWLAGVILAIPTLIFATSFYGTLVGTIWGDGTTNTVQTTRWNTNAFYLYFAGDPNVGNNNLGTLWQWSASVGAYTNGLIAYSNIFVSASNAWEVTSNTVYQYQGAFNSAGIYGGQISGFNYSKAKGHIGPLPAPRGFIAAGNVWSNAFNAPPLWGGPMGVTNDATSVAPRARAQSVLSALAIEGDNFINVGYNNSIQNDIAGPSYQPMGMVASYNSVLAAPGGGIFSSHDCTNFDANGFIIGSTGCTLYRGSGDDGMIATENCFQQNFANSVCLTMAAFGTTNFSDSTSILGAAEFGYMDGGTANFARMGGITFYDNVNVGLASGSFQTNGLFQVIGGTPAIWDLGNGNTVQNPNTIFFGFTNVGLLITPSGATTATVTATPGASFTGDGSGLTNMAFMVQTNFISGRFYTNTWSGSPQINHNELLHFSVQLTAAAVAGRADMDLVVGSSIGTATIADSVSFATGANTVAGNYYGGLNYTVTNGQVYAFTNQSTGAGNSSAGNGSIYGQITFIP